MKAEDWPILKQVLEEKSWSGLARTLRLNHRTLYRYRVGEVEPPEFVLLAIEGALCRKFHQHKYTKPGARRFAFDAFQGGHQELDPAAWGEKERERNKES